MADQTKSMGDLTEFADRLSDSDALEVLELIFEIREARAGALDGSQGTADLAAE